MRKKEKKTHLFQLMYIRIFIFIKKNETTKESDI